MLRTVGVILLALCVVAMPSYAAVACGSACETSASSGHEHDCCPTSTASAASHPAGNDDSAPHDSRVPGRHHCAAPCCGFVAHVLTVNPPPVAERPLGDLSPAAPVARAAVDHEAIFHPPRA